MKHIAGKTICEWEEHSPLLGDVLQLNEVFWSNPKYQSFAEGAESIALKGRDIREAEERLERFAPYLATAFPETKEKEGIIESPLVRTSNMKQSLEHQFQQKIDGELFVKCDSHLAVSGSIKARGGIYEVLKHAEELAMAHGLITEQDPYRLFASETFKNFFSSYSIVVGSTGNLGLSIGIIGAKLGFYVTVHMSADAQQWKKDLLREKGVTVFEHSSDYEKAVEEGRKQSEADPNSYFVDDENSMDLFLGYATAAARLKTQLEEMKRQVDEEHPLFVYLPCGVGGAPGGVTFGLKTIFQDHVHCIFAEPTHSPSMLIGLLTGRHDDVSVYDFGIDNETVADGLAVGRPSRFVGKTIEPLLSGSFTVADQTLFKLLRHLADTENLWLEPSALAGVYGPVQIFRTKQGQQLLRDHNLTGKMEHATHIVWATGGSMVPKEIMARYYERGRS